MKHLVIEDIRNSRVNCFTNQFVKQRNQLRVKIVINIYTTTFSVSTGKFLKRNPTSSTLSNLQSPRI